MALNFIGSPSSRFFLGIEEEDISLLRDEKEIWKRKVPGVPFRISGVADNGFVAVLTGEDILLFPSSPKEEVRTLPGFSHQNLAKTSQQILNVKIDKNGERLSLERATYKSKLSEKMFRLLASSKTAEKGKVIHEVFFFDIVTENQKLFYRYIDNKKIEDSFSWDISSDFEFLITAEIQKSFQRLETKFNIVEVPSETIYYEFAVPGSRFRDMRINKHGTALIDFPHSEEREILIINAEGEKHKIISPQKCRVYHLGKDFVALEHGDQPLMTIKSFEDEILQEINFKPLEELGFYYKMLFNERDDIDFITSKDGYIKTIHSSLEMFGVDTRRWELLAKQKRIDEEKKQTDALREKDQRSERQKKYQQKTLALSQDIVKHKEERNQKDRRDVVEILRNLENARLRYITGQLAHEDYRKLKATLDEELRESRGEGETGETKGILPAPPPSSITIDTPPVEIHPPGQPCTPGEQKKKLEKLLEAIEERFILGEMSEAQYLELKGKYKVKLDGISLLETKPEPKKKKPERIFLELPRKGQ